MKAKETRSLMDLKMDLKIRCDLSTLGTTTIGAAKKLIFTFNSNH